MHPFVHASVHPRTSTHTHTHTFVYTRHTCEQNGMHACCDCICMHAHIHTHIHICIHTYIHKYIHTATCALQRETNRMACMYAVIVFACMHTYHTYIHTHTEIHTYIHTYSYLRTVAGERERDRQKEWPRGFAHPSCPAEEEGTGKRSLAKLPKENRRILGNPRHFWQSCRSRRLHSLIAEVTERTHGHHEFRNP